MKKDLLTTEEVADELTISVESARKLMTSGQLAYVIVTVGRQRQTRRVLRSTLEAFKQNEQRAGVRDEVQDVRQTLAAHASVEEYY